MCVKLGIVDAGVCGANTTSSIKMCYLASRKKLYEVYNDAEIQHIALGRYPITMQTFQEAWGLFKKHRQKHQRTEVTEKPEYSVVSNIC